jgi:hypothetical protein
MLIKFNNGTQVETTNPTEQKVFKSNGESGWIITFSITTPMTSTQLDELLTGENISLLTLMNGETSSAVIEGYDKVTMVTIRYTSDVTSNIDVQMSKGL